MTQHPKIQLLAVHIADGFLMPSWLIGGFVGIATIMVAALAFERLRTWWQQDELREEEIAYIAVLTSAFFVASLIHIRIGPITVHLLLNGLLGVVLRWRAALAIPIGLLLQAALFGHGGFSTLGVNACVLVLPALFAWFLFVALNRLPWINRMWIRGLIVAICTIFWLLSLTYGLTLIISNNILDLEQIEPAIANQVLLHPITVTAVVLIGVMLAWLEPKLEHAPEFPVGLLIGTTTVLATMFLNCLVLIYGGSANLRSAALATFVAHSPIAVIEGIVLGFVIGFLAKVKPGLLGLTAAAPAHRIPPPREAPVVSSANGRPEIPAAKEGNSSNQD